MRPFPLLIFLKSFPIVCLITVFSVSIAQAQTATPGDDLDDAIKLPDFMSGNYDGSNMDDYSLQGGEPLHYPGGMGQGHSIWFRWDPPQEGDMRLAITGNGWDPIVSVYRGPRDNPTFADLVQVVSGDTFRSTDNPTIYFRAKPDVDFRYYIAVASDAGSATPGDITLRLRQSGSLGSDYTLLAAVLPSTRAAAEDEWVTAFATVINNTDKTAFNCGLQADSTNALQFSYQQVDRFNALDATPNETVNTIRVGAEQRFVFAVQPKSLTSGLLPILFDCENFDPAPIQAWVNDFYLAVGDTRPPDMVAIGSTPTNNGILDIVGTNGSAAFSVATVNNGGADMQVKATPTFTGTGDLLDLFICQTDPATGACLSPPAADVTFQATPNTPLTFTVIATAKAAIPFDAGNNRISVIFAPQESPFQSLPRVGGTTVAVRTQ